MDVAAQQIVSDVMKASRIASPALRGCTIFIRVLHAFDFWISLSGLSMSAGCGSYLLLCFSLQFVTARVNDYCEHLLLRAWAVCNLKMRGILSFSICVAMMSLQVAATSYAAWKTERRKKWSFLAAFKVTALWLDLRMKFQQCCSCICYWAVMSDCLALSVFSFELQYFWFMQHSLIVVLMSIQRRLCCHGT